MQAMCWPLLVHRELYLFSRIATCATAEAQRFLPVGLRRRSLPVRLLGCHGNLLFGQVRENTRLTQGGICD